MLSNQAREQGKTGELQEPLKFYSNPCPRAHPHPPLHTHAPRGKSPTFQHGTSACPTPAVFTEALVPRLCMRQRDKGAGRYQKGSKCVQMLRVSLVI